MRSQRLLPAVQTAAALAAMAKHLQATLTMRPLQTAATRVLEAGPAVQAKAARLLESLLAVQVAPAQTLRAAAAMVGQAVMPRTVQVVAQRQPAGRWAA